MYTARAEVSLARTGVYPLASRGLDPDPQGTFAQALNLAAAADVVATLKRAASPRPCGAH